MSKENPKILKNAAYCKLCKVEIESKGRWDFKFCECGNVAVDGGKAYIKRVFKNYDDFEDRSVYDESREPNDSDYNTT